MIFHPLNHEVQVIILMSFFIFVRNCLNVIDLKLQWLLPDFVAFYESRAENYKMY